MLEVAGGDHHTIDVFAGEHFLGVFVGLRIKVESFFQLGGALLPSQAPDVAHSYRFNRYLFGSQLDHVHMAVTASSTTQLREPDAIIRPQDPGIGTGVHSRGKHGSCCLLHEGSTVCFEACIVSHSSLVSNTDRPQERPDLDGRLSGDAFRE